MGSALARRTYALFIFLAVLPILVVGYVLVDRIGRNMAVRVEEGLRLEAKQYGLMLFQRMELADRALTSLTNRMDPGLRAAMHDLAADDNGIFDVVSVKFPDGYVQVEGDLERHPYLQCEAAADRNNALAGTLRPAIDLNGNWAIALVRTQTVLGRQGACVIGIVRPAFLWRLDALAQDMQLRVLDPAGRTLVAFDGDADEFEAPVRVSRARAEPVTRPTVATDRIGAAWELYLRNRFGVSGWEIVVSRSRESALADITEFRFWLLLAIATGAGVLALLSSILIRRAHRPLVQLLDATRRIGAGDFSQAVSVDDNPDVRTIGTAFNDMMRRLARHFDAMALLSSADQQILRSIGVDSVLQSVLNRAQDLLQGDSLAVLLLDTDCPGAARLYTRSEDASEPPKLERREVDEQLRRTLLEAEGSIVRTLGANDEGCCLCDLGVAGMGCCSIVPIRSGAVLHGALLIGYRTPQPAASDPPHLAASLADRLAVAITHSSREQELFFRAHYDPLTGLPNRALLRDRVEQAIVHAERSGSLLAMLFLDLDRFKYVNDSMGHATGDLLLAAVARRLTKELPDVQTISRLGGDEFVIVAGDLHSRLEIETLAARVLAALREPLDAVRQGYVASTSVGVAIYPDHGTTFDHLLQHADSAMYVAKNDGGATCAVFEESMGEKTAARIDLEAELRLALARGEFELHYQPQINLRSGKVSGAEALIRWRHPQRGFISPMDFIPVAEETGQIVAIGYWVVREVCRQIAEWRTDGVAVPRVAINVSVQQMLAPGFVDRLRGLLGDYRVRPDEVELEVTESVLAKDIDRLAEIIWQVAELGCCLAIDDFGTGYSSLSYLQKLPIQVLKIDRSFLPKSDSDFGAMALCEAIIGIGIALGKSIVAEGVETYEQRDFLASRHCHLGQGYLFGRPMSAADLSAFVGAPGKTQRFLRRVVNG